MPEQRGCYRRRRQVAAVKKELTTSGTPNNRGAYLYGLRSCRLAAALTQRQLAHLVGTHQSTIYDLERRNRGAYPKTIRRLCQALEVEPVDLLCGETTEEE